MMEPSAAKEDTDVENGRQAFVEQKEEKKK